MPSEGDRLPRSKVEDALEANLFVREPHPPSAGFAIWYCNFFPGADVILDLSRDWVLWGDVKAQLVDQGFPTAAIAETLDA